MSRLKKLESNLELEKLDAFVIVHLPNVRYLCGFSGSSGVLAFAAGEWALFTDGRYTEQARRQVQGATILIDSAPAVQRAAVWVAEKLKSRTSSRIGIEAEHASLATATRLAAAIREILSTDRCELIETVGLVERLRIIKDAQEIAAIRDAVQRASSVFPKLLQVVRSKMTENDLAAELDYLCRRAGAEKMSFESIVASGERSALPHARPTQQRIGSGFLLLDYGVILGGYCSDMTRTICIGDADARSRETYSAVLESQLAGIAAVAPGVEAQQVDAAARDVLKGHGLDMHFTHSLGHGVGIEIHEAPRLGKGQADKLEPGMIVTVEPGVYIAGKGGVRIEDMVLVTESGCEVLTPTPKELVTL